MLTFLRMRIFVIDTASLIIFTCALFGIFIMLELSDLQQSTLGAHIDEIVY